MFSAFLYALYLLDTRLNIKYGATSTTSCSLLFNDIGREMVLYTETVENNFVSNVEELPNYMRHKSSNGVEPFLDVYLHSCCL